MKKKAAKKIARKIFRNRVLLLFVAIGFAVVLKHHFNQTTPLYRFYLGVTIVAVVQTFRIWTAAYLHGNHFAREVKADFLCTSGPYTYLRNPLYLFDLFIGIGFCIMINEWYVYILFLISYVFVYSVVIPYEEEFLERKFGENYIKYKKQTHKLIPNFRSFKSFNKTKPDWKAGLIGEIHAPITLIIMILIIYVLFVR